jgi:diguanylate cyclase (GGDEF)-like protein
VLLAAGVRTPGPGDWRWLALGTLAQFALDALVAAVRMASIGVSPLVLVRPLWWTFRVDALMAVIGAGLVLGAGQAPAAVVVALVAAPVALVRMLGRDRVEQVEQSRSLGAAFESASLEAVSDPMTGLGNRRRWERAVADAEQRRQDEPAVHVGVLMADLDGLKHANDTYGHDAGDALIQAFAEVLVEAAPAGAAVARLGGDEFGVLVVAGDLDVDLDGDAVVAAVRAGIARRGVVGGAVLSASLGWAATPPLPSVAEAAAAADERALASYRAGRTCHPLLPFADWAACAPALDRLGAVFVAGCRDATAARQLGFIPTHGIGAALEMAQGRAERSPRIGFVVAPPYFPLQVGG